MFMYPYIVGKLYFTGDSRIVFYSRHKSIKRAKKCAEKISSSGDTRNHMIFVYDCCLEVFRCTYSFFYDD